MWRAGLRAQREARALGQIRRPGCSLRGRGGRDGGEGSRPVWPSVGVGVGVGVQRGAYWGLGSPFLPAPSGQTSSAPDGLSGDGHGGQDPALPSLLQGYLTPKQGGSARPLETSLVLLLHGPSRGGLGYLPALQALSPALHLKDGEGAGNLSPRSLQRASTLSLIVSGIFGAFGLFRERQ